tara:strand:+ start:264 stop:659 length:396 start_codon:yes stop_codon:yes gene_type:complete
MTKKRDPRGASRKSPRKNLNPIMTETTGTKCTVELPFDLRFTIRLHTTEEHLEEATEHFQDPDKEWALQAQHAVQRWLNQEIVPNLRNELHDVTPFGNLDSEASWLTGIRYSRSHVNEATYVADEAGLVDE